MQPADEKGAGHGPIVLGLRGAAQCTYARCRTGRIANTPGLSARQDLKFLIMVTILALLGVSWLLWRERRKRTARTT